MRARRGCVYLGKWGNGKLREWGDGLLNGLIGGKRECKRGV